jgi:predicted metalloprotease with PDZ domain
MSPTSAYNCTRMSFLPPCLFLFVAAMSIPFEADAKQSRAHVPAQAAPLRYTLRFPAPHTHYVEVEAQVPTDRHPVVELDMAVWTPGSYLVREYARHVERVTAEGGGKPLAVTKTVKNRWRIATGGAAEIAVRYRVYGREMTVRTNFIDRDFAMLNGAPTFLTLAGDRGPRPHEVTLELPASWKTSISALPDAPEGGPHRYRAPDYDTLVDSPILAGNPAIYSFTVQGIQHVIVNVGEGGVWDGQKTVGDVQKIVETVAGFWGTIPYDRYVFFNLITEASGGLEHRNSCTLMTSRWKARTRRGYVDWLSLVSHELFHAWNVKRLRPSELGPFDYDRENPTRSLWVAEGITSYYGDLLAARAGVLSRDEYLNELGTMIAELQSTPGRLSMPVEDASFDAWIRYYRPDENSPNVAVSYYTKGGVVGFLLDIEIRRATNNARSLDDVMRLAWRRYSGARGFTPDEFRALVSEVAGRDLSAWLQQALASTDELDYTQVPWLGLRIRNDAPPAPRAWLGLAISGTGATLRNDGGRLVVTQVRRGTPAFDAGVNVDDEILAIGEYRVRPEGWDARLEAYRPGDRTTLVIARRERLMQLDVVFAPEPARVTRIEPDSAADAATRERLAAWLKP